MEPWSNTKVSDKVTHLIEVSELKVYYPAQSGGLLRRKFVRAVDGVSFYINPGEVLGLVGESGSGKTTIGRAILRLVSPTEGRILFKGKDIASLRGKELKKYRKSVQMIFQDPFESLNPRQNILSIIAFPLLMLNIMKDKDEIKKYCAELLNQVGLSEDVMYKYPHELSGGERQRVAIARAIAVKPEFIVADEPVSMLDVSVRSGILNLLMELKNQYNLTYLLITHDLQVAYYACDRIAVMYLGKIVELAPTEDMVKYPLHPYTQLLLSAAFASFSFVQRPKRKLSLVGEIASAIDPPKGCRFHPRCPFRVEKCEKETPSLVEVRENHFVACHNITFAKY
jgi:oligopeptide/dipeptide ABC transporter ATP-binding protein